MSEFVELANKMKSFQEEIMAKGRDLLQEYFVEFFNDYPEISSITWTQYTPYFNDGDECVFSVGDINFGFDVVLAEDDNIPSYPEDNDEDGHKWYTPWGYRCEMTGKATGNRYDRDYELTGREGEIYAAINEMQRVFGVNEDVLKSVFGGHSLVYVDRSGSRTDEYDHD